MKALVFEQFGGPEVLAYKEIPAPELKPGTVLVRLKAAGLNYADIYRRRGNYHLAGNPPYILGYEGAGIVEEAGADAAGLAPGDRIAFCDVPHANAELVRVPVEKVIPLPADISFETAAAVLLQGMTAHYLTQDSYKVQEGDEVLVHAAAGGVGQLLVQLAKRQGARVLGLVSSEAKRDAARAAGADEVLLYSGSWAEAAKSWSAGGEGVSVAYDSVGSTLMDSFAAVRTKGTVVFYGMAGGDPAFVDPRMLMDTSKTLTGGDLWNHVTSREDRIRRADELFGWLRDGSLKLETPRAFSLAEGAEAHRLLESRRSTGKIILLP
ncbi:quinone oxidoreductase [Paenibacillus glycanilyticus]|uniref:quinone oxidoreductase family protein n=1 Tax=Paenibacillus glycanilyticus TaxID=126569 RepID=UPI00203FF74F|nr:quinone oxidoreductase [Paenibacillus glycanilyticus]MCM3627870.1 quinone oxidoreductase [Paenibacillus glycanilyticus]